MVLPPASRLLVCTYVIAFNKCMTSVFYIARHNHAHARTDTHVLSSLVSSFIVFLAASATTKNSRRKASTLQSKPVESKRGHTILTLQKSVRRLGEMLLLLQRELPKWQ
jgi:hypothetical protein